MKRWWVLLGLSVLLLALSGCAGGARQESWPGQIVVDGVLYAADVDHVRAFDAETGDVFWSWAPGTRPNAMETGFYATPTYDAERNLLLVAGFHGRKVYALQLTSNVQAVPGVAWVYPQDNGNGVPIIGPLLQAVGLQPDAGGAKGQYVAGGAIGGELFVIGNGDGNVYALNLANGALVWQFSTQERVWTTPTIIGDTVYVASMDHTLYALNLADGALKWEFAARGAMGGAPVLADGGLWIGDFGDRVYRLDPATGQVLWTYEGEDWFWATGVLDAGRIFFADVRGNVFAFDTRNPALLWRQRIEEEVFRGRGVLSADGERLYLPGYKSGAIHVLEAATGSALPRIVLSDRPGRLPGDLKTDGERIYVMPILTEARLQTLDAKSGKLLWQYPLPK